MDMSLLMQFNINFNIVYWKVTEMYLLMQFDISPNCVCWWAMEMFLLIQFGIYLNIVILFLVEYPYLNNYCLLIDDGNVFTDKVQYQP